MAPTIRSSRRIVVATVFAGLAGCTGDDDDDDEPTIDREGPTVGVTELSHNYPVVIEAEGEDERVADVHYHGEGSGEWHFQPLEVPLDDERRLGLRVRDADGNDVDISATGNFRVEPVVPADDPAIVAVTVDGEELILRGEQVGDTEIEFDIVDPEGDSWRTPELRVAVEDD